MKLNVKQERLLMQYNDGECGFIKALMVKRLLANNNDAKFYLESLTDLSEVSRSLDGTQNQSVDLWGRVERRLEEEERTALYLGKRRVSEGVGGEFFNWKQIGVGISGLAATAALVMIVFVGNVNNVGQENSQFANSSSNESLSGNFAQVSYDNESSVDENSDYEPPRILGEMYPSTMEVDWMRSSGGVRVLQSAKKGVSVIWVNKRKPANRMMFVDREDGRTFGSNSRPVPLANGRNNNR